MNPDGSVLGNLRTNAAGANLNREWLDAVGRTQPEVNACAMRCMRTGCDAFFDIHGDENLPYVFVAAARCCRIHRAAGSGAGRFCAPISCREFGFPERARLPRQQVQGRRAEARVEVRRPYLRCLSLTLEMPFKDNANAPDPRFGWSGARSARLGAAMLGPIHRHLVARGRARDGCGRFSSDIAPRAAARSAAIYEWLRSRIW